MSTSIDIREVGLRDGLQLVKEFVPTETKLAWLRAEAQAGVRRFEVSSFVSSRHAAVRRRGGGGCRGAAVAGRERRGRSR